MSALVWCCVLAGCSGDQADTVLLDGRFWTGDTDQPWAEAVAIEGDRLVAVGTRAEVEALVGPTTRVIELGGRLATPGFIDNHTHFDRAGALLLGVNLLDVSDGETLARRVAEARDRLPQGAWIQGGDWGAYEAWSQGSSGAKGQVTAPFEPHRAMIDDITGENPVLLSKWDRSQYLANAVALASAAVGCDWEGVDCDEAGAPTGRLEPVAAHRIRASIPEKSLEQRLSEARVALTRLAENGITGIHDITSASQLEVFQRLESDGELTTRVYARPTLDQWQHLAALGIRHGFGDEWIRIGGLKGFVDGIMGNSSARFYEPYLTSGEVGSWRAMMSPEGNMPRLIEGAIEAGHWPQIHAIGDEAIDTLLDFFESALEQTESRPRLRVIHTQVIRGSEVADRMARLGIVAEVQPYHAIDDMRWMEQRIGQRARWAYAFRTLHEAGVMLSFGSDWPGTNASWYPSSALLGIYAAVTRQTLDGTPAEGWFPQERVDLETALRAYTVNNAWAAGEEALKGALEVGKLADLVVLDRDLFAIAPEEIKATEVLATFVGGRLVLDRLTGQP